VKPKCDKPIHVAVCTDARASPGQEGAFVMKYIKQLLQKDLDEHGGTIEFTQVEMKMPNIDLILDCCDIFFMCGGDPCRFGQLFTQHRAVMQKLTEKICSGEILYIGSCGGACMAGLTYVVLGQDMLGVIPALITVSDNEASIPAAVYALLRGTKRMITMTKKTAIVWHGMDGHAFVCTSSGILKYKHLVAMINEQIGHIAAGSAQPLHLAKSPTLVPPLPGPPLNQQPAMQPTANGEPVASVAYCCGIKDFGTNKFKVWSPHGKERVTIYIVYLPSTWLEDPDARMFTGKEIVMTPIVTNHGKEKWRNALPAWIPEWLRHEQHSTPNAKLSLVGFSRGAAWGLEVAAHPSLRFHRVLLIGSYFSPWVDDYEQEQIVARLARLSKNIMMVWGLLDPWQPKERVKCIGEAGSHLFVPGINHEGSLRYCTEKFWKNLILY
jgi:hypothetical protein